ncbi:hypothetical protein QVD17_14619 [Tagetes erecta]|uniref:pectinesterase n=1 Tax=Tagetes erecta TaxID=13708 RepID=A0AAD8KTB1_TARER|nr:hypothetical protein QVD17_14619 [Tagetes erecta]
MFHESRSKSVNLYNVCAAARWTWLMFMCIIIIFLNGVKGRGLLRLRPCMDDVTLKMTSRKIIVVDGSGSGKYYYKYIQDAIDSIPDGNQDWVVIHVNKGIYREKVRIGREKSHIFLRGSGRTKTAIFWSQTSENNYHSSTFKVEANDFIAFGISFKNEAPTGIANSWHNQSVAAYVGGDRVAFYSCGFYSSHNTLLDHQGRHYYDRCYIQGAIDVIFGHARSVFHECEIFVVADKRIEIQGSVTGHGGSCSKDEKTGFVFLKGRIYGIGEAFLGRPRGEHSRVVFANTYMSKTVRPQGWTDWNHHGSLKNVYHGEYKCHGPGSSMEGRAPWLHKLTAQQAAPYLSTDFIHGKQWLLA